MSAGGRVRQAATIAGLILAANLAMGDIVAYDGFGGDSRPDINGYNGGSGWSGAWVDNLGVLPTAIADGLAFPGLATTPGGAVTPPSLNLYDATEYAREFGAVTSNRLYVSFLYQPSASYGSYGGIQFGYYPTQVFIGSPMGYYTYGFRVGRYGFTLTNVPELPGTTVFLVLELETLPSTNQTAYRLFVDPMPGGARPSYPEADVLVGGATLPTALTLLNDGGVTTDEIRVGTTWASVTPASVCPGDLNQDGTVDLIDLATLLAHFGTVSGGTPAQGDSDADGDIDLADLAELLANFGIVCR